MAQSTTNLGKIHVFPSEALYNQFKDIIADNDLALLKDDGAYIVAALLEQNGYVKFSNGLILQWGYRNTNNNKFAFLLTYTSVPLVFSMGVGKGISIKDGYGRNADNITKAGFTTVSLPTDTYPIGWLSIGF